MAEISAKVVMDLRGRTGCGMMDCKKALAACDGDIEKAIDYLREKGARVMVTTDSHSVKTIDFGMEEAREIMRETGFKSETVFSDGAFTEQALG